MTTTKPRPATIAEAQARLASLDQEEAGIPAQRETKEQELDQAQSRGDFQRAAVISAELQYMAGPNGESAQRDRIARDRQAAQQDLYDALATELERQAADLETNGSAQKVKEEKALAQLEEISGCKWMPKQTRVERQGRFVTETALPLSQQWQNQAKYRRDLAAALRSPNPDRFKNTTREALKLIESIE